MHLNFNMIVALLLAQGASSALGAEAQVLVSTQGTNTVIQILGSPKNDWRIQSTTNLSTWIDMPALGTLLSGDSNAPMRVVGSTAEPGRFYRAVKTDGLFDPTLLRTITLTFTQANWPTMLAKGRTTGTNTICTLTMDNGATNHGVGARYKGNTSYSGMFGGAPKKKSINLEFDFTDPEGRLMGYKTVNLNNAFGDETIMREALYFAVMQHYTPCPKASLVKLVINGTNWGVYSFVQQENNDLIKDWFPSDNGDRWKAPNMPGVIGTAGPGAGMAAGGGFSSSVSALSYLGTNAATYRKNYELATQNSTNPWAHLINCVTVLNRTPTNQLRDKVENVLAVDRWLWFLAIENIFADDDSYFNKGADYGFYYEPESGRIHPIEHDGNEAFTVADVQVSPIQGASGSSRPVLQRLLGIPELRQRYLAHMRTVLQEYYNPVVMTPLINRYGALSAPAIALDTKKGYTMATYTNDLKGLRSFITNRYKFLTNHVQLRPMAPHIAAVYGPAVPPTAVQVPLVTAEVRPVGTNGVNSVWLYFRDKSYGRFAVRQMFDDGAHGDGAAGDGVFGAATTNHPAGTKVRYYVEARSANAAKAASFSPAQAEQETFNYRVALTTASSTPVIINEFMASNAGAVADPQGESDDWIELHNVTDHEVDLTGRYLSDEPNNPRKWAFPGGTKIPADGYLVVWADEDGAATQGLHASFKLSASGEQIYLIDTDANFNAVLDTVEFGPQETNRSYGRTANDADVWTIMPPTPGTANR